MGTTFLSETVWPRIRELMKLRKGLRLVAVPFLSPQAAKQLPLRPGDVLITRFDDGAIKGGLVDPREVVKYIRRRVEVHAVANLHAKVFVINGHAIVGSTNVSRLSESQLIEAACETSDIRFVADCRRFVKGLRGEVVELEFAKSKVGLYKPPIFGRQRVETKKRPVHSTLDAVKLRFVDLDREDKKNEARGKTEAEGKLDNRSAFRVECFLWSGDLPTSLRPGTRVLRCTEQDDGSVLVAAPARVLLMRKYKSHRGTRRALVFVEVRKRLKERSLKDVISRVPAARALRKLGYRQVRDLDLAVALTRLWPAVSESS